MTTMTIFIYALAVLIGWIIFYYVVKAAVKNGIRESLEDKELPTLAGKVIKERPANSAQIKLQQQYDKGEITFEEFKTQWSKLNP